MGGGSAVLSESALVNGRLVFMERDLDSWRDVIRMRREYMA